MKYKYENWLQDVDSILNSEEYSSLSDVEKNSVGMELRRKEKELFPEIVKERTLNKQAEDKYNRAGIFEKTAYGLGRGVLNLYDAIANDIPLAYYTHFGKQEDVDEQLEDKKRIADTSRSLFGNAPSMYKEGFLPAAYDALLSNVPRWAFEYGITKGAGAAASKAAKALKLGKELTDKVVKGTKYATGIGSLLGTDAFGEVYSPVYSDSNKIPETKWHLPFMAAGHAAINMFAGGDPTGARNKSFSFIKDNIGEGLQETYEFLNSTAAKNIAREGGVLKGIPKAIKEVTSEEGIKEGFENFAIGSAIGGFVNAPAAVINYTMEKTAQKIGLKKAIESKDSDLRTKQAAAKLEGILDEQGNIISDKDIADALNEPNYYVDASDSFVNKSDSTLTNTYSPITESSINSATPFTASTQSIYSSPAYTTNAQQTSPDFYTISTDDSLNNVNSYQDRLNNSMPSLQERMLQKDREDRDRGDITKGKELTVVPETSVDSTIREGISDADNKETTRLTTLNARLNSAANDIIQKNRDNIINTISAFNDEISNASTKAEALEGYRKLNDFLTDQYYSAEESGLDSDTAKFLEESIYEAEDKIKALESELKAEESLKENTTIEEGNKDVETKESNDIDIIHSLSFLQNKLRNLYAQFDDAKTMEERIDIVNQIKETEEEIKLASPEFKSKDMTVSGNSNDENKNRNRDKMNLESDIKGIRNKVNYLEKTRTKEEKKANNEEKIERINNSIDELKKSSDEKKDKLNILDSQEPYKTFDYSSEDAEVDLNRRGRPADRIDYSSRIGDSASDRIDNSSIKMDPSIGKISDNSKAAVKNINVINDYKYVFDRLEKIGIKVNVVDNPNSKSWGTSNFGDGSIELNLASPDLLNTTMHEFTHTWLSALYRTDKKSYNDIKRKMVLLYKEALSVVNNDEKFSPIDKKFANYILKTANDVIKKYNIEDAVNDSRFADELLANLSGEYSSKILKRAKESGAARFYRKAVSIINQSWKTLSNIIKKIFGLKGDAARQMQIKSVEDAIKLINTPLKDLFDKRLSDLQEQFKPLTSSSASDLVFEQKRTSPNEIRDRATIAADKIAEQLIRNNRIDINSKIDRFSKAMTKLFPSLSKKQVNEMWKDTFVKKKPTLIKDSLKGEDGKATRKRTVEEMVKDSVAELSSKTYNYFLQVGNRAFLAGQREASKRIRAQVSNAFRNKQAKLDTLKSEVKEYITDNLIPQDRSAALGQLSSAKTEQEIKDVLRTVDEVFDWRMRKSYLSKFRKLSKTIKKNGLSTKLYTDLVNAIDSIPASVLDNLEQTNEFFTKHGLAKERIALEKLKKATDKYLKAVAETDINTDLDLIEQTVKEEDNYISPEELNLLNSKLALIIDQRNQVRRLIASENRAEAKEAQKKIKEEWESNKVVPEYGQETKEKGLWDTMLKPFKAMESLDGENFINTFFSKTLKKIFWSDMKDGSVVVRNLIADGERRNEKLLLDSFGKDYEKALSQSVYAVKGKNGSTYKLSRAQVLSIIATYEDPNRREIMENGMKGKVKFELSGVDNSDVWIMTIPEIQKLQKTFNTKADRNLIDGYKEIFFDRLQDINKKKEDLDGVAMTVRGNKLYFPTHRGIENTETGLDLLSDILVPNNSASSANQYLGFMKARTKNSSASFRIAPINEVFDSYNRNSAAYVGLAEELRTANRVLHTPGFKSDFIARFGKEAFDRLQNRLFLYAGRGEKIKSDAWGVKLTRAMVPLMLTASSAIKQLTSILSGTSDIDLKYILRAIGSGFSEEARKSMLDNSDLAYLRYREGPVKLLVHATNSFENTKPITEIKSKLEKLEPIRKAIYDLPMRFDEYALQVLYKAAELQSKETGENAVELFERTVNDTQNTTDLNYSTGWQEKSRSGSLAMMSLTMFLSQQQKNVNNIIRNMTRYKEAVAKYGKDSEEAKKQLKRNYTSVMSLAIAAGLQSAVSPVINAILGGGSGGDDDDEYKEVTDLLLDSGFNFVGNPLWNTLAGSAYELRKLASNKKPNVGMIGLDNFFEAAGDYANFIDKSYEYLSDEDKMESLDVSEALIDAGLSKGVEVPIQLLTKMPIYPMRYLLKIIRNYSKDNDN